MAHIHETGTTVIDDRSGPSSAILAVAGVAIVGLLVWFFAFSGVVFDRDGGTPTRIEQNVDNGGSTSDGGTTNDGTTNDGTSDEPQPTQS